MMLNGVYGKGLTSGEFIAAIVPEDAGPRTASCRAEGLEAVING